MRGRPLPHPSGRAGRVVASSPLRIDQTTPKVTDILVHNRSREPFQGDNDRLTTISPNGDGLRESAKISFTLSERARVHFEVTRTVSAPQTIYELTANLRPGRNTFTWHPHWSVGARTYLVRITATDGAGNRRTYGADNAREGRRLKSAVVRVLGVDAGFTAESYVAPGAARLAIETDATSLTLQTFRAGPEDTRTHSDTLMNGVPVNQPVTIPWSARHRRATLNFAIGPWPTGVYFVKLTANDRRIGFAPFIVRPTVLGEHEPCRRRDADEHVAGLQLPRRRRQRLGRHVVREGGPEHRGARPHVHPPRCAATVAQVRRRLRALAARDGQAARHPDRDRSPVDPHGRGADSPLRLRRLPRPHRVRDPPRVRPDPELPRPRRQPRLPLREQLLLGGPPRGPDAAADAALAGRGRPESALLGVQYRANDDGRLQRPSSSAPPRPLPGSSPAPVSATAPSSARSSAATGSRSTRRRR